MVDNKLRQNKNPITHKLPRFVWHVVFVAVSRGYDMFFGKGLWCVMATIKIYWFRLKHSKQDPSRQKSQSPVKVSIDHVDLCQTHCKQVPDFSRATGQRRIQKMWTGGGANTRSFRPVPAFGSIWVVLWLLFFRSAPSRLYVPIMGRLPFMEPVSGSP